MLGPDVANPLNRLVRLDTNPPVEGSGRTLFGLDEEALRKVMLNLGEPAFRGRQLAEALYRQRITDIDEITTLPLALRAKLAAEGWSVNRPRIAQCFVSVDGTERYLVESGADTSETVETVWMPEGDDGEAGDGSEAGNEEIADRGARRRRARATICVSSQIGCAVNCQFCLTARLGLKRNLTAGQIAGQVVAVLDRHLVEIGRERINLVFMGMGEPFLNYDAWIGAVRLLVHEVGLSPQRMTVSTSGIVPGIERFAAEAADIRPKLAISLNAPNNDVRSEVMPINRKWSIEDVVEAVRAVQLRPRERVTFEYVLLGGVTDQQEHAREVARLIRRAGLAAKVNLIAWNPGPGVPFSMPAEGSVARFHQALAAEGIPSYLRKPRGRDIYAACGQLKRTVEG
ncbi:MAG TPA: 23S rRNA (adenine(2503)-C(2))-methyltransferase RlmN [Terracidiphilus sp.]|nr:23S rRNA (adenine(2503)-C(2))-methyltransferase RlmN [Terracidiphilus sp.]